jgi:hypothetical protein
VSDCARTAAYDELLADIAEGARLHYEDLGEDPDRSLLEGDHLYARGLAALAELGDLEAVRHLADAISQVAQARAAGDRQRAATVWAAGVAAVRASAHGDAAAAPSGAAGRGAYAPPSPRNPQTLRQESHG